jgi:hypothetical protein
VWCLTIACEQQRQVEIYRLPAGFRGWVLIKYGFKEGVPLKTENGAHVFEIPKSGVLTLSGYTEGGWVVPKFYLGDSTSPLPWTIPGKGGWVWSGSQGGRGEDLTKSYQIYFVGPESDYLAQVNDPAKGKAAFLEANW